MFIFVVFFFKQKTAYEMRISDWSSDVCSSDLSEGWDLKRPLPRAIAQDPSLRWGDSGRARAVHRNEPLRRGAEDDLSLRPPRMRIAVREIVGRREQRPRRAQIRTDRAVGAHELLVDDRSEEHTSELQSLMRI